MIRFSVWCFGLLRKIYISLGYSCEPNHISNLKDTLRQMHASLGYAQSMMLKGTDALTKMNRISQDLRVIDENFSHWQDQLNRFSAESKCHESILFEFLSKHSNTVNRAFASLLQLNKMQDILHQFSTLETKTIFGFPYLPPFLNPQIISRLKTDPTMTYTVQALTEGFPLLLNPMVDIEHQGQQIEASVLLTIPEISNLNSFCTVEYLSPIKINSSNICYSGPVTKSNLVLISCPNSKQIVTSESLAKCKRDSYAIICPANILNTATNFTWLGFPFNPDTKLTFQRNHVRANDCSKTSIRWYTWVAVHSWQRLRWSYLCLGGVLLRRL